MSWLRPKGRSEESRLGAPPDAGSGSTKVFVSYSRDDLAFVERLCEGLTQHGIDPFIDREDIAKGEEWWDRLKQLMTEADTVVFAISPSWFNSDVCKNEVEFAESLNKRLIPIVAADLQETQPPEALARLNYIFFVADPRAGASGDFDSALAELVETLGADIGWIREHTRLGALAERWQARSQPKEMLLRGAELEAAEAWLSARPASAPEATDTLVALISHSRRAATRRQRQWVAGSTIVSALSLSLAAFALVQWNRAEEQLRTATAQRLAVQSREALAEALQPGGLVKPDLDRSALLALESLARRHTLEGDEALRDALRNLPGPSGERQLPGDGQLVALGPQAGWIATAGEAGIVVHSADGAEQRVPTAEDQLVIDAAVREPQALPGVLGAAYELREIAEPGEDDGGFDMELVATATGKVLAKLPHEWAMRDAHFRADGTQLMTLTGWVSADASDPSATRLPGSTIYVWAVPSGELLTQVSFASRGGFDAYAIDPSGDWLAVQTDGGGRETIAVMPIWPDLVVEETCRRVRRPLSPTEIEAFLYNAAPRAPCVLGPAISE